MRVLIADDAGFMREMLTNLLEGAGHEVIGEASNGPDTLLMLAENRPDVLLLDLVLPDMNGIEVAIEALKADPTLVILAMSALDQEWIEEKVMQSGCRGFLHKPFSREVVLQAMELATLSPRQDVQNG